MKDLLLMLGILVIWIGLNRWVLPWFGIPTCMSGGCGSACSASQSPRPSNVSDADVGETQGR